MLESERDTPSESNTVVVGVGVREDRTAVSYFFREHRHLNEIMNDTLNENHISNKHVSDKCYFNMSSFVSVERAVRKSL